MNEMSELIRRLFRRPGAFAGLVASSLFVNLLGLAVSLYVIQVLNRYIAHGVDATLQTLILGAILAVAMEFGFRTARMRMAEALTVRPDEELSLAGFRLMSEAQAGALEQLSPGLRRKFLSAADGVQNALGAPNVTTILDLPFALLFIGALALLSPVLALITGGFAAFVLVVGFIGMASVGRAARDLIRESAVGGQQTGSVLQAADTVRAFNASGFLIGAWQQHVRRAHALTRRIAARRGRTQSITQAAMGLMSISVIGVGAVLVVATELDIASLIGANILAARALATVSRFALLGESLATARQNLRLIGEMRRLPSEIKKGSALSAYSGNLAFKDVAFAHQGQKTPLYESVDLTLEAGQVLLVHGDNGTGKTTLCRLILGLIEPQRGDILVDGVDLRQIVPLWWRRQVCYLPQEPAFLNATLAENLRVLRPDLDDNELNAAIEAVGLKEFLSRSPAGFNTQITENGGMLSLGVRRRLALARALVSHGRLVVWDEPTEGLDPAGCQAVYAILKRMMREGRTIVTCTHDSVVRATAHQILDLNAKPVPRVLAGPAQTPSVDRKPAPAVSDAKNVVYGPGYLAVGGSL